MVPLLLHRHRLQGFSRGQSASITRMSSERLSPITSYQVYGSSHEISYLNHHQKMKGVQDRGDSDPVLETPVFPSMTSNNEQGDVPERSAWFHNLAPLHLRIWTLFPIIIHVICLIYTPSLVPAPPPPTPTPPHWCSHPPSPQIYLRAC